ncbi:hypothetical protein, partial [Methanothrix sp.]|uniref:hypothetical protein n=1 Tax=Methanothrix sp. TaxID=90426 RepID=UPI003C7496C8
MRYLQRGDHELEIMLFLGGLLGLALSRINILAVILFAACYSILVYRTWVTESPVGLALCSIQSSLVLAFRFEYLTWGDPWFEYSMILKIMKSGSLSPAYYPDQQPALHTLIAAASEYMHTEAMLIQKFLIPAFSAAGILALYLLAREFFDSRIAIATGLLLSVGTAYIHWISQAATESLGIPMALVAFYLSYRAFCSTRHLPAALIIISCIALTHHLTSMIFVVWINSFAIAYLLFVSRSSKDAIRALSLSLFAFAIPLIWWNMRLPSIYRLVVGTMDRLLPATIPGDPVVVVFMILISVYVSLSFLNNRIIQRRAHTHRLQTLSMPIYYGLIVLSVVSGALVLNFLLGRSFFVLSYPPIFYANGLMMIILALVGLRGFMNTNGLPFLAWSGGVAVLFLGSMLKLYYFEDPLRFIEFIYPPLALISAYGFVSLVRRLNV